jgi:Domain of unknown function (DUF4124)
MIALTAAVATNAEAIYKCTTPKGVVYQDRPCREGAEADVQIVIPTGEIAPRATSAQDTAAQPSSARIDSRAGARRQGHAGDDTASSGRSGATRTGSEGTATAGGESRRSDAGTSVEKSLPMTAEEARKTEPTAKYYTTDAAASGSETPEHMTCESPSGEKRRFILTNGKLTSI